MQDKIKKLKSKLVRAKKGWHFVSISIKKFLQKKNISYLTKHYLFQCQVSLYSDKLLLKRYDKALSSLKANSLTLEEFEYVETILNNLIADYQAKAILINNLLK